MHAIVAPPPPESKRQPQPPLLPDVLLGPASFLWLWALPMGVLLLLNLQAYWLVEGNLDAKQRSDALLLGAGNACNLVIGLAIYLIASLRRRTADSAFEPQPWWGVPALLTQIAYLWWAVAWTDQILPRSVTTWIYPEERFLFNQFAFAMLPLFLGILRLAGARPSENPARTIVINLGFAIGAPVALYLFILLVSKAGGLNGFNSIAFATGMISLGVLMFAGLVRALIVMLRSLRSWGATGERAAIIIFAAILPLCGLLLNRSIPFPVDFQAWEIYGLVVVNAAILLLASLKHAQWPRLSFYLLCATFPFSLYFFIVFLPYTPLSILAIIAMGAGFLVLAPIFLFVLHLHALHQARRPLIAEGTDHRVTLAGILCFLLLPAFFTSRALADKTALNAALDYVYSPAITAEKLVYPANVTNLRRALSSHRSYKNGIYYPLLSDFYSWLVFDHLVLPDDKLDRLEQTFFGVAGSRLNRDPLRQGLNGWGNGRSVRDRTRMPRAAPAPRTVGVEQLDVKTTPTTGKDRVTTFTLTLRNNGEAPAEFAQKIPLPSGVFVSGFRLHINGEPVPGRIFEKKTALWVYTMIRDSERRDPGLLYYNTRDELELRVFPVNGRASAVVEIDFIHPGTAVSGNLNPRTKDPAAVLTQLGASLRPQITRDRNEFVVTGLNLDKFPRVEREPYLHLIIDRSSDNAHTRDLSAALPRLKEKFPQARLARVTLVNFDVVDLITELTPLEALARNIPAEAMNNLPVSGGLALDLCLARAIRQHRDLDLDRAAEGDRLRPTPVFVILSSKASTRKLELELTEKWSDLLPGLEIYELGADGALQSHLQGTRGTPLFRLGNTVRPLATRQALRFPAAVDTAALTYWSPPDSAWRAVADSALPTETTPWSQALTLQLQDQDHGRTPGTYRLDRKALVHASRESGILLPVTSYIVVENSAQWKMLELSERQKLDQNDALDFRETPAPPAIFLGLGLVAWMGWRRWRQRSVVSGPGIPRLNGRGYGSSV
jgi:hypothetical protein